MGPHPSQREPNEAPNRFWVPHGLPHGAPRVPQWSSIKLPGAPWALMGRHWEPMCRPWGTHGVPMAPQSTKPSPQDPPRSNLAPLWGARGPSICSVLGPFWERLRASCALDLCILVLCILVFLCVFRCVRSVLVHHMVFYPLIFGILCT